MTFASSKVNSMMKKTQAVASRRVLQHYYHSFSLLLFSSGVGEWAGSVWLLCVVVDRTASSSSSRPRMSGGGHDVNDGDMIS